MIGLENVAFKPTAGGYVFQANASWWLGRRRSYFVTEAQKADIAACTRETLRRIKPFALIAAVVIPILLIGGALWLAFHTGGGALTVTITSASGQTTSFVQPIDADGSTVTVDGEAGAKVVCHVSGPPSGDATMTYTFVDASGKAGPARTMAFGPGGAKLNIVDSNQRPVNSAVLVGRAGATPNAIMAYSALLALALFAPYLVALRLYSVRRMRPLIAGLPRSDERISRRDVMQSFAAKSSFKLLALVGVAAALGFIGNGIMIAEAMLEHRPLAGQPFVWLTTIGCAYVAGRFLYLLTLRLRLRRSAAV